MWGSQYSKFWPAFKIFLPTQAFQSDELRDPQGYNAPTPPEAECFLFYFEIQLGKTRDLESDPPGKTSTRTFWEMAMRLERDRGSTVSGNLQFLRPRLVAIDGLPTKSRLHHTSSGK